jgi:SAM-dependent methyltransferase
VSIIDRTGVLARLSAQAPVAIELGCGPAKADPDAVGIDALDLPGVTLVGDVFAILQQFPDASVRRCTSSHFLEHIADLTRLITELERVLAPGGELVATVPHFSNPYFYSDPTHTRTFGLYSMSYLSRDRLFRRAVPLYGREPKLDLLSVRLEFDSPFPGRRLVKKSIGPIFNLGRWWQEFYEENLSHLFPCYQLTYRLRRREDTAP